MPRLRLAVAILAAALVVGACGTAAPSSGAIAGGQDGSSVPADATAAPATREPVAPDDPRPTDDPAATAPAPPADASDASDAPAPTDAADPTEAPDGTEAPNPGDAPDGSPAATERAPAEPSTSAACSGSDDNRAFFDAIANSVDWPVLCGVLPRGWFVSEGRYRLANGGWLRIGYAGPGGTTLKLAQGAACAVDGGCDVRGAPLGPARLGPLEGTLYRTGGGYAIVAAPGENPSWHLATTGLDQAATLDLAAALAEVGG